MGKGKLYGVSVGPGDPELMTLKAVRIIREADVIALPHKDKEKCVSYKIAVQSVPEMDEKEFLMIHMPMTKDREQLKKGHEDGVNAVAEMLDRGKNIAFLTLGDVCIYSSCQYIYQPIKEMGYDTELISGVPSFCAAAARLDRPLVSGEQKLHIIPASYDFEEYMQLDGVKVLMKAGKNLDRIKALDCKLCGVENCGMDNEKIYKNKNEIGDKQGYYSLFIAD